MINKIRAAKSSLSLVGFLLAPIASGFGLTVDVSDIQHASTLKETSRGVTQIYIVQPDNTGLSHNKFTDYNVDPSGITINNSMEKQCHAQLGCVEPNPNFQGSNPAKVIQFEVRGATKSQLEGVTWVAGKEADFILINPNGVVCNGGKFINTPLVTFSTENKDGKFIGDIIVAEKGMEAEKMIYLKGKKIEIQGPITSKKLICMEGHLKKEGNKEKAVAIDVGHLGYVKSGSIYMIATEEGIGVKSLGKLEATAKDIFIKAKGEVELKGEVKPRRNVWDKEGWNKKIQETGTLKIHTNQHAIGGSVLAIDEEEDKFNEEDSVSYGDDEEDPYAEMEMLGLNEEIYHVQSTLPAMSFEQLKEEINNWFKRAKSKVHNPCTKEPLNSLEQSYQNTIISLETPYGDGTFYEGREQDLHSLLESLHRLDSGLELNDEHWESMTKMCMAQDEEVLKEMDDEERESIHKWLDLAGMLDSGMDAFNAILYFEEGNKEEFVMSAMCASIPCLGKAAKYLIKKKGAKTVAKELVSLSKETKGTRMGNIKPPSTLEAFPNAKRVNPKTPLQGGGSLRKRWKDESGKIYEWDRQHGTVEIYRKNGKHLGEFDPKTGKQLKEAIPSRRVEP